MGSKNSKSQRVNNTRLLNNYNNREDYYTLPNNINNETNDKLFFLSKYHKINLQESDFKKNDECPICLEELQINDKVYLFPCCHYFHIKCFNEWFLKKSFCPVCCETIGNHKIEEIDMALFNRDIKNTKNNQGNDIII